MNGETQTELKAALSCAADSRLILEKALARPGTIRRAPLHLAGYHLAEAVRLVGVAVGNEPAAEPAPTLAELIGTARERAGLSEGTAR
jgi:hypothetical protein